MAISEPLREFKCIYTVATTFKFFMVYNNLILHVHDKKKIFMTDRFQDIEHFDIKNGASI